MCWAAAERMARVAALHDPLRESEFRSAAERIRETMIQEAWREDSGTFVGSHLGSDLDASLLQMAPLRFLPLDDRRVVGTVASIRNGLSRDGWLLRYETDDGFGKPSVAFIICTFWLVEALAAIGQKEQARDVMRHVHAALSPLGLISEDYETSTLRMWGNFPQAYSHVGLIHAAFAASPPWADVL
jgi:GH15 family glucan-1,4-alpha-glucosidase